MNERYQYHLPVEIIFEEGGLEKLASHPLFIKAERPLIVAGDHFKKEGWSGLGNRAIVYSPTIRQSDIRTINQLTSFCRQEKPDLIVGIGGGTIIDVAKSAAVLMPNHGLLADYLLTKSCQLTEPGLPFVAVPTTAGTGSEVTPWATVWDLERKKKYSLSSQLMFPALALVDPYLTRNLPAGVTASTGADALTQAIEAYWSRRHNPFSDIFALEAIRLIMAYLPQAVQKPDGQARTKMALGSLLSGLAFANTKTTICHAVSYPMTAHWGISHGQAVAITLPLFLKFNASVLGPRRKALLAALQSRGGGEAARRLTVFLKKIGLAVRLSDLGLRREDLAVIVRDGFQPDRADNTPRIPTKKELRQMLEEIL